MIWRNSYDKITLLLMLGDSLIGLSTTITTPYIALYLLRTTHYSPASVGWVVGLSVMLGILCSIIGGYLSDYIGRGKLIYISLLSSIIIYLLYYISSFCLSKIFIMIAFIILGGALNAFRSIYVPVSQAFIADYMPNEKKAKCFQLIYIASNIGAILAPILSMQLGIVNTRSIFLLSALFYSIYVVLMLLLSSKINFFRINFSPEQKSFFSSFKILIKDICLRYHLLSCFAVGICCAQFDTTLSQYLNIILPNPAKVYSMLIFTNCLTVVVFQSMIMNMIRNLDISKMIVTGCLILALGFYLMSLSQASLVLITISVIMISMGQVFLFPNFGRFIDLIAPEHLKGFYYGISFLRLLGCAVGTIIGGYFVKYYNGQLLFMLTALVAILAATFQAMCLKYPKLNWLDL